MNEAEEINLYQFSKMENLDQMIQRIQGSWFIDILKEERINTYFQPIIDSKDFSIFAYECLTRSQSEDGAIIMPGTLINQAIASNVLMTFDRLCRKKAIIESAHKKIEKAIFLNFLPSTIYQPEFCLQTTFEMINKHQFPHDRIVFEVVETEEVHDTEHLINILSYYRNNGFKVALDDFGAGYSSFNMLHKLKPDYVKIDMELIRNVHQDKFKSVIVKNLLKTSQDLGIITLAEGIETKEEMEWLHENGVNLMQGYYFARPSNSPTLSLNI